MFDVIYLPSVKEMMKINIVYKLRCCTKRYYVFYLFNYKAFY